MRTDIRVVNVEATFAGECLRTPLKFGAGLVREITSCTVRVEVENRAGARARGLGNILLSDLWAWPSPLEHAVRDGAMRALVEALCREPAADGDFAHPVDHFFRVESVLERLCADTSGRLGLAEPVPLLAGLVCLSPIDAAVHDACGLVNGVSSYALFGAEFMREDLSRFVGPAGKGRYATDFLDDAFAQRLPAWHLVGGVDKLRTSEKTADDPRDGLPVSLDEWIRRDGIFCFKVKLRGSDVAWDVARTIEVAEVAAECLAERGGRAFWLSVDSNECSPSPEAVVEYLTKLKERAPDAFRSLLYVEQPTERDLEASRFDMRPAAAIKPVLADEGITDLGKVDLAHELGWSGIALKTCKCHTDAVLATAKARLMGMVYSVQDLTNVGLGLVHSAGLAARISPIKGVEYNSRQFLPRSEADVVAAHPRLFGVTGGCIETTDLSAVGLGYNEAARAGR